MTTVRLAFLPLVCAMCLSSCTTPRAARTETPMGLIEATARVAGTGVSRLPPAYIWATLKERDQDADLKAAFEAALAQGTPASRLRLMRVLELRFIHDPKISGLDILGPELSQHFRDYNWHADDFPGGPKGPNEQFADVMVDTLDLVRPERRANRSREAVVLREEATAAVWPYITNQWVAVPGQERWKLNHQARESFVRMREQARVEGVDLVILSGHRDPQVAQANAARAGNANAVASFSAHSLGLALNPAAPRRACRATRDSGVRLNSTGRLGAAIVGPWQANDTPARRGASPAIFA